MNKALSPPAGLKSATTVKSPEVSKPKVLLARSSALSKISAVVMVLVLGIVIVLVIVLVLVLVLVIDVVVVVVVVVVCCCCCWCWYCSKSRNPPGWRPGAGMYRNP